MAPIFFDYERSPLGLKKVHIALDVFNTYLARLNTSYVAADHLTIADFPLFNSTMTLEAIGFDFSKYEKVCSINDNNNYKPFGPMFQLKEQVNCRRSTGWTIGRYLRERFFLEHNFAHQPKILCIYLSTVFFSKTECLFAIFFLKSHSHVTHHETRISGATMVQQFQEEPSRTVENIWRWHERTQKLCYQSSRFIGSQSSHSSIAQSK